MKKIITALYALILCASLHAQTDVTKFLGFPVDGSKSEMIRNLRTKGFRLLTGGDNNVMSGKFNGVDVKAYIITDRGKVSRIMVCDKHTVGETDIKIRFNNLCQQFNNNGKYISFDDYTIPDGENIDLGMALHKRYEAVFYQLPEGQTIEDLQSSIVQKVQSKFSTEQLNSGSDELKSELYAELRKAIWHKPVWFIISSNYGEYSIIMYYDNELNRAQGEDL
jgi:hypothetical protein